MTSATRELTVLDYHTEGEPMRIVVDGVPPVPGASLMARSEWLAEHGRGLMGFILYEPRGHAAMCAAILTEPVSPVAQSRRALHRAARPRAHVRARHHRGGDHAGRDRARGRSASPRRP